MGVLSFQRVVSLSTMGPEEATHLALRLASAVRGDWPKRPRVRGLMRMRRTFISAKGEERHTSLESRESNAHGIIRALFDLLFPGQVEIWSS